MIQPHRIRALIPALCAALFMASSVGMDPLNALVTQPAGRGALVGGIGLDVVGLVWTGRLARAAERAA